MNLFQHLQTEQLRHVTRRHFLRDCTTGLGGMWLASQGIASGSGILKIDHDPSNPLASLSPTLPPKVKRVIYLHMVGAPSQLELFDYKPQLQKYDGKDCPQEYLEGQRFAFIQGVPKMLGPQFEFKQHGQSGAWISDRLPELAKHADKMCFIKTMQTDQFNHGPAQLLVHTGNQNLGYPSMGSWVTWGLGTENQNLPGFMVLISGGRLPRVGASLWGSGFLPSVYQGVQCRSAGDPVLNAANPQGVNREIRRAALDSLKTLNEQTHADFNDPETVTRIAQYEMAFRMQVSVPEVMTIDDEPAHIHEMYGTQPGKESFANNCLLARRLAENGVRFIQLFDWGWDSHGSNKNEAINHGFKSKCDSIDKPISALLTDLDQRGMLDDTLVVWGGEFGRTPMQENRGGGERNAFVGRDHNPNAFTLWMAGAGVKPGMTYGETDDMGYLAASDPVHIRDFHATLLQLVGFEHKRLAFPFQGLDQRLTGVKPARIVKDILA
ncbi:sulfatase [Haloferula helveola]|uniref:Sulfatase n=1 Tax=Haloferula helveola TaxID=490095 RepID=A0ABM7RC94_9BACT|nr:sulfatase [Haloferula helveola]